MTKVILLGISVAPNRAARHAKEIEDAHQTDDEESPQDDHEDHKVKKVWSSVAAGKKYQQRQPGKNLEAKTLQAPPLHHPFVHDLIVFHAA